MKKFVRVFALALALLMLVSVFVGCGKRLSGTFKSEEGAMYVFDGAEFTYTGAQDGYVLKGSYVIEEQDADLRIFLTVEEQGKNINELKVLDEPYVIGGEKGVEFIEREGFIRISETKYMPVA